MGEKNRKKTRSQMTGRDESPSEGTRKKEVMYRVEKRNSFGKEVGQGHYISMGEGQNFQLLWGLKKPLTGQM